jgi:hypothetical protein
MTHLERIKKEQKERRIFFTKTLGDFRVSNLALVTVKEDIRYYDKYIKHLESELKQ